MFEVGREKVKIDDEQNRQALRNVDPNEPFHRMGLAAIYGLGQELELISQNDAVMRRRHLWLHWLVCRFLFATQSPF